MKTTVFFASPNSKGNTYKLLEKFLKGLNEEVEIVNVYKKKISPCVDCKKCYEINTCAIKDDMIDIYDKLDNSDIVVFAFPVYFSSVPAPLKALIDRLQIYWSKKYIRKDRNNIKLKKGVILSTSGIYSESMFNAVEETLKHAFLAVDAKDVFKVYAYSTDKKSIGQNNNALDEAYKLGETLKMNI